MKKFSKIIILLLAAVMALCLIFAVGCGEEEENKAELPPDTQTEEVEPQPAPDEPSAGVDESPAEPTVPDNSPLPEETGKPDRRPAPDGASALLSAVENLIREPADFKVDIAAGERDLGGLLYVDLHAGGSLSNIALEKIELRAILGDISVWLEEGKIYLAAGDIKVCASVDEIAALIQPASAARSSGGDILGSLFGGEFTVEEGKARLVSSLGIGGAEIPLEILFDADGRNNFTLTEINTEISVNGTNLSASLTVCDGETPAALEGRESFIGIGGYARDLAEIFASQYLTANINYIPAAGTEINGKLRINTATFEIAGNVSVKYGEIFKTVDVIYKNGWLYLSAEGLKYKLDAGRAAELLGGLLPANVLNAADGISVEGLLQKLSGLRLTDFLSVGEENNSLQLVIKGTELLKELGFEFATGDINASVANGELSLSVLGVKASLSAGARFRSDISGYDDVTPVLAEIPALIQAGGIEFAGDIKALLRDSEYGIAVNGGALSWKEGIELYLDLTLTAGGTAHDMLLNVNNEGVKLAYGGIGAEVSFGELPALGDALLGAYNRVRELSLKVAGENSPLPAISGFDDLVSLLKEGGAAVSAVDGLYGLLDGQTDIEGIIKNLTIRKPENGGLLGISLGGLSADLKDELGEGGWLGLEINCDLGGVEISGEIHANILGGMPAMPVDIQYLGAQNFEEMIDFAVAAVNTLCQENITLSFRGQTAGRYKSINADITYHSPDGFPVIFNAAGKSLRFDPQAYVSLSLELEGEDPADGLYLGITVIDGVRAGDTTVSDGILDFYVSVSRFGNEQNAQAAGSAYVPLTFHASADEVLTLLSGALVMLGADDGIIDEFFVTKWITGLDDKARLEACGNALLPIISGLLGGQAPEEEGAALLEPQDEPEELRRNFLKKLACGENTFELEVDTGVPGGKFVLTIAKTQNDGGENLLSLLSEITFGLGDGSVNGSLSLGYGEVTPATADAAYDFAGADELLLSLARSVTHEQPFPSGETISGEEQPHVYSINNYYYIDGTISASLFNIIEANIDLVAISVSVDEKGIPAVNIRLAYQGLKPIISAINGDSTVDITIKEGMVYMKRVQTSYFDGLIEKGCNEVLYRAMPLENFFGDILNQLGFILNFGDMITDQIAKADTSSDSGSEGGAAAAVKDYGTIVGEVLKAYTYSSPAESGASWTLELNGSSFSKGILGNFTINLTQDENGLIRGLNVSKCEIIPVKGLTIVANLNLVWHNAGGVSDQTVDATSDVGEKICGASGMGAMIEKLAAENGWAARKFIEGKEFVLTYVNDSLDGTYQEAGSQNVMVSTGADGFAANTLYSDPVYPEAYADEAVYGVWTEYGAGDAVPTDGKIHAAQFKRIYTVTFFSGSEIEGWNCEPDGRYSYTAEMEYGAEIIFENDGVQYGEIRTVKSGENVVCLPDLPQGGIRWTANIDTTGAKFGVLYSRDTVNYHSDIKFAVNGGNYNDYSVQFKEDVYNMITPEAEGYIFLGWFEKTESGWNKVTSLKKGADGPEETTVEALWAKTSGVELTASRKGFISYTYSATATLNEITFYGFMADGVELKSVEYNFNLSDKMTLSRNDVQQQNVYEVKTGLLYYRAWVEVTAVYTLGDNEISITQQSGEVKL